MPGSSVKDLYVAKSIEELQSFGKIPPTKPMQLVKSAQTIFNQAGKEQENGDEERAYVLYMKYFQIYKTIKSSKDYAKDKTYFDSMISSKTVNGAMNNLETLQASLEARYKSKKDEENRKNLELKKAKELKNHQNGVNSNSNSNSHHAPESHFVSPTQLYALINEKSSSFLILDGRPANDYKTSHLKHNSLNVPEDILKPGIVVQKIERQLHIGKGRHQLDNTKNHPLGGAPQLLID